MKPYRGRKSLLPKRGIHSGLGISRFFCWYVMPYGSERRKMILEHLERIKDDEHYYMIINKKYCPILKRDPDLKHLLKQGKLKMEKIRLGGKATVSILVLNKEV